jgi:TonB family protein
MAIIFTLCILPEGGFRPEELPEAPQRVTPLTMPPELTQRDPNNGKVSKDFEVREPVAPRQAILTPPAPPPVKRAEIPKPAPVLPPVLKPPPPAALPDPPKAEAARATPPPELPRAAQPAAAPPPPPQIQVPDKPKLTFDSPPPAPEGPVPADQRRVPLPSTSIDELAQQAARGGTLSPGSGSDGLSQSPTQGNPLDAIQLKTDPEGVDFKPYLLQLIETVRRNWRTVIPQSARMGRGGRVTVSLQFRILKDGTVDKIIYVAQSGSNPLDRAAVAGISMSNPVAPLPRDFRGNEIVLQLNFEYR